MASIDCSGVYGIEEIAAVGDITHDRWPHPEHEPRNHSRNNWR